jgi:hypothetical protein
MRGLQACPEGRRCNRAQPCFVVRVCPALVEAAGEKASMLQALSPMVAVALRRAQEARDQAAATTGGTDLLFWREMERQWVKLAQSYEMAERLHAFITEQRKKMLN